MTTSATRPKLDVLFSDEAAATLFPRRSYSDDLKRMDAAAAAVRAAVEALGSPGSAQLELNGSAVIASVTAAGDYVVETWREFWCEPSDDVNAAEQPEDF